MSLQENNKKYYPALDGLRGIAIIFVLLYHSFNFTDRFFFGWLGVDLFFVLSGFLITTILLKSKDDPRYFRNFYARRTLRIFPLYYLILIIFLVILPFLNFYQARMEYYNNYQLWFWFYIQNWLLSFHSPPLSNNVLTHLWSLAVEEQCYLVWPFIMFLIHKTKSMFVFMLALLVAVVIARGIIWSYHISDLNYTAFYTFTRVDGICIGSLIALLLKINPVFLKKKMTIIVIILACFNFLFYFLNEPYGILPYLALCGYTTFAILFGLLVIELVTNNKPLTALFSFRPLIFLGKLSYGLYIFHWPVYAMLAPVISEYIRTHSGLSNTTGLMVTSLLTTIIAILISIFSYYNFEMKFLKLKNRFR